MEKLLLKNGLTEILLSDNNRIVKLFDNSVSQERVHREVTNMLNAKSLGVNIPEVFDVIHRGDRTGIEMEYVEGPTISDILSKTPYKIKAYARKLAQVQVQINEISTSNFTEQRAFMRNAIIQTKTRLGEAAEIIIKIFEDLPGGQKLCHNDLHQENIIFSENGPVILDWAEATIGNPVADIVHSMLVQEHPVPAPILKKSKIYYGLHNKYRKYFARLYNQEYRRMTGVSSEEIARWVLPVAVTRLFTKKTIEEKVWTENYIKELMNKRDYN